MMNNSTSRTRRSGFTLIEVAIALAIFVFGALAIVQIFPPALGVIRNNESRITATQLGETLLAQTASKANSAPEAIYDVADLDNNPATPLEWSDYPAAVIGTVSTNASLPASPHTGDIDKSALGRFHYIHGEPHYIGNSQQILLNRPVDTVTGGTPLAFHDQFIEGVQIKEDGYLDFSLATLNGTTFSDPANRERPPTSHRRTGDPATEVIYYVSYRWQEAATPAIIRGVLEEPLSIPADDPPGWDDDYSMRVLACVVNTANKAIPGTVRLRMRRGIAATPVAVGGSSVVAVSATVPGTYYFSYLSRDWHELTDDNALINDRVRLPIQGIESNSLYGILTNSNFTQPAEPSASSVVDSKKGEVAYTFAVTPPSGARVRTVYKTLDGWAQQLSVAARTYIPFSSFRTNTANPALLRRHFPSEPWREYYWTGNQLYFHPSEAGKTISVSYTNTAGDTINGVVLTIDKIETGSGLPSDFYGSYKINKTDTATVANTKVAYAVITDSAGNPVGNVASILSVQGLSIHARTAWQNADRYNQVIVPAYRTLLQ